MNELKSYTEYAVSTPTADFVIGFDFNYGEDAVNVTVDDVPATEAGYTVVYLNETTIRLSPSVPSGVVRLQRETDIDQTDHAYRAGAKFIAQTMDENFEQLRHSQQEVRDGFSKLSTDTHEIIEGLDAALELAQDAAQDAQDAAVIAQGAADTVNTIIVGGKVGASNVLDASGETQQQVNYNGGAKWHSRVGGYKLNERVILNNGDSVKSTIDANPNDPNVDMTGWEKPQASSVFDENGLSQQQLNNKFKNRAVYLEDFGASEGADCTTHLQAAFDYARASGGAELKTNLKNITISSRCTYHDNTTFDFNKCKVSLTGTGQICSALYNADRSVFTSMWGAEIYYKYQATRNINNPNSRITTDANKTAQSIIVESSTGFQVGDYVLVSNGYCDMWRVMEQYATTGLPTTRSYEDWVRPDVDLWRCEIMRIKSITGTTIVFEDRLENDYKATPKTYGFFSDENNRADYQTWNYPFIERLGGASNCKFKNIIVNNQGSAEVAILGYGCVNNTVLDSQFYGNGQGVDFVSCFNSHALRSYSDTEKFGQSIRRGSQMCILANATAKYVSGDCPLIIWEGANHCVANNLNIDGTGGDVNHAKIGFYFNTCWNNVASNIVGKNLSSVAGVMFCRGGNLTTGITGTNCGILYDAYASFEETAITGVLKGTYKDTPSIYDSSLFSVAESSNVSISKMKHLDAYSSNAITGRAHIFKSFGVELDDIKAPNVILWNSIDDDKVYNPSEFKQKTKGCVFKQCYVSQTYENSVAQTRRTYFKDTDFMQNLNISYTHNVELKGVKVLGGDSAKSVILTASHFTRFIDCEIRNATTAIDFKGAGAAGSENATSMIYMRNTLVDAPTKFLNYADPSFLISTNAVSNTSRGVPYISVITNYPKIRLFGNPLGDGNTTGWMLVEDVRNTVIESYTTTELQTASSVINRVANKWLGREVFNTTVSKFMKARGSSTTAVWVSDDGVTTITPT